MRLVLRYGLVYADAEVEYKGKKILLSDVIIDTGSLGTIFSADFLEQIGVIAESDDPVYQVVGVGGSEAVFGKRVDVVRLRDSSEGLELRDFSIEVGAMQYGFPINGIIGLDFLLAVGAVVDLHSLAIYSAQSSEAL